MRKWLLYTTLKFRVGYASFQGTKPMVVVSAGSEGFSHIFIETELKAIRFFAKDRKTYEVDHFEALPCCYFPCIHYSFCCCG